MGGAATVIRRFHRQSGSLTVNDPKLRLTLPRIRIGCSLAVMAGRYPLVPGTVSNSHPDQLGKNGERSTSRTRAVTPTDRSPARTPWNCSDACAL